VTKKLISKKHKIKEEADFPIFSVDFLALLFSQFWSDKKEMSTRQKFENIWLTCTLISILGLLLAHSHLWEIPESAVFKA